MLARSGARVIACARSTSHLDSLIEEMHGDGHTKIELDLEDIDAVRDAISTIGVVHILVNNAGSIEPISHLAESDPNLWVKSADVNYKAVYFGIRSVLPIC